MRYSGHTSGYYRMTNGQKALSDRISWKNPLETRCFVREIPALPLKFPRGDEYVRVTWLKIPTEGLSPFVLARR